MNQRKIRIGFPASAFNPDGSIAFPDFDISAVTQAPDVEVVVLPKGKEYSAADLRDLDILVSAPGEPEVTRAALAEPDRLGLVVNLSIGHENVDLDACSDRGIAISLAVDPILRPTAIATITMLLAVTTKLLKKHDLAKQGPDGWAQAGRQESMVLDGKTLGIVGLGRIGQQVARFIKPFGMKVIACDPYLDPQIAADLGVPLVALDEVFSRGDVVTLHTPLNNETRGMITSAHLGRMKPTAYLLNLSRGPVTDRQALYDTLASGRIAGAGLDVFHDEPMPADDPLLALPNVTLSAHVLAVTGEMWPGLAKHLVDGVAAYREGKLPKHVQNQARLPAGWPAR